MRVIIAGGRNFNNYKLLYSFCHEAIGELKNIEIVSGGAKGADALGEKYAAENSFTIKVFKANWKQYGRAAGIIRNKEMAAYADRLIVFWDEESKGTQNIIQESKKRKLPISICLYKNE